MFVTLLMIQHSMLVADLNFLINRLEHDSLLTIEWFENINMKLNQDECHVIVSGHKYEMYLPLLNSQ